MQTRPHGYRNLSYVLVKVHDECKTEAMLLDIWKARGRSGSQGRRALADGRWREKSTVLVFCSEFAPVPFNRKGQVGTVTELFKPRENLCLYGSFNTMLRPTRKEANIHAFSEHPVVAFSRITSKMVDLARTIDSVNF
jgi:hypothetical protein